MNINTLHRSVISCLFVMALGCAVSHSQVYSQEYEFHLFDGQKVVGSLAPNQRIDSQSEQVRIVGTDKAQQTLDRTTIAKIVAMPDNTENPGSSNNSGGSDNPDNSGLTTSAPILIALTDNSRIAATDLTIADQKAEVAVGSGKLGSGKPVRFTIDESMIATVRLDRNSDLDQAWTDILKTESAVDLIFPNRKGKLTYYRGAVQGITPAKVLFLLDGESLPVAREKLCGLKLNRSVKKTGQIELCQALTPGGSTWSVGMLETDSTGYVTMSTRSGVDLVSLGAEGQAIEFRFPAKRNVFLTDLPPESMEWQPMILSRGLPTTVLQKYNQPKIDTAFGGKPLQIQGEIYQKGMCIKSRTELVWRLPDQVTRLSAVVGIDDSVRPNGAIELKCFADQTEIFSETITGKDEPTVMELPLTGVNRLKILVDFGLDAAIGDVLTIGNPVLE